MIGLTIKYKTLAGEGVGTPEGLLLDSYGGLEATLSALREQGVGSIEISAVYSRSPMPVTLEMIRRIYDAGLRVSLHGGLEDMTGEEYLRLFAPVFELVFSRQPSLSVTLHGLTDRAAQDRLTSDWAKAVLPVWPGLTFALENQRVRNETFPHEKDHFRIDALPAQLPKLSNMGICWDMGHYAYNVVQAGLPVETLPSAEALSLVRHTHIHCLKGLDTHHPILPHPISEYVGALKNAGYKGLYNIEVKPDKYHTYLDVREGMEDSIRVLREVLGE